MYEPNSQGPVENMLPNVYYQTGQEVTVSDQTPVRVGYTFVGWNTNPDGTGTAYQLGDSFTAPEGDLTLFAQWEEDNNPIIMWIIIGIFFVLIFVSIIIFSLYYANCDCEYCAKKKE